MRVESLDWHWFEFSRLDSDTLYDLLTLRQEVFVIEQACLYLDTDGLDRQSWHLVGYQDGQLVATLRIVPPGIGKYTAPSIGRVATARQARGLGLGKVIMAMAVAKTCELFPRQPIILSAQAHLRDFYAAFGFQVTSDEYLEDGIPHLEMKRPAAAV